MPQIFHIQIHEGADMKGLGNRFCSAQFPGKLAGSEHVAMPLAPGSVVDLRHDKVGLGSVRLPKTVIERDRIENKTEMPELGQQANRAGKAFSGLNQDFAPDTFGQRFGRISEMVRPVKAKGRCPAS